MADSPAPVSAVSNVSAFAIPELITSINASDVPMVLTLTFLFAILIVGFSLIADLLYGWLDPRIRYD